MITKRGRTVGWIIGLSTIFSGNLLFSTQSQYDFFNFKDAAWFWIPCWIGLALIIFIENQWEKTQNKKRERAVRKFYGTQDKF